MVKKGLTILGSTGSIGQQTLAVARYQTELSIYALTANTAVDLLVDQCEVYHPSVAVIADPNCYGSLVTKLAERGLQTEARSGVEGLRSVAVDDEVSHVMAAIVGSSGLMPTYSAAEAGKTVLLANKEALVMSGAIFMSAVANGEGEVIPVDSEHNAIFQVLNGRTQDKIRKLVLTASGGPFRDLPLEQFPHIRLEDALSHPNWEMGNKITIDSATMMNKGLEVIEARWLFDMPVEKIEVVIHRESIIHSMEEFCDGSTLAQLGFPDMRIPISYCLGWPERLELELPNLDLTKIGSLNFTSVEPTRYPCLELAIDAARMDRSVPAVLNGANEAVVESYLKGHLHFVEIAKLLQDVMSGYQSISQKPDFPSYLRDIQTLEDAVKADQWGREEAQQRMQERVAA